MNVVQLRTCTLLEPWAIGHQSRAQPNLTCALSGRPPVRRSSLRGPSAAGASSLGRLMSVLSLLIPLCYVGLVQTVYTSNALLFTQLHLYFGLTD